MALIRLDGQYGDAAVIAQIILAGVYLVVRSRGYQLLEHPHIQGVLAHPPTASVTAMNTGMVVSMTAAIPEGTRCSAQNSSP